MLFTELRFFAFLIVVLAITWSIRTNRTRKAWLLACSYLFYAAWDWRFLTLIWISTIADFCIGLSMQHAQEKRRKQLLILSLGVNLGILGFFKYFGFFVGSTVAFLEWLGLPAAEPSLRVILPVGISFYTFQTLSYSIDVFRRRISPTKKPLDFALYVGFFPQLVAGPIERARNFLPQLDRMPDPKSVDFRAALWLFLIGYFKKACVSDNLSIYIDAFFRDPGRFDQLSSWIATLSYTVQIYCDFSGYTDMAIACAAMLGYRLSINFDHPYLTTSLAHYWRRWHISLSSWLMDYLYIPLGGNRGPKWRTRANLLITMVLGGLWHGAAWTYVIWGACHGLYLILEREIRPRLAHFPWPRWLAMLAGWTSTMLFINAMWFLFRAPDFATGRIGFETWIGMRDTGTQSLPSVLLIWLAIIAGAHIISYYRAGREKIVQLPFPIFAGVWGGCLALCLFLVPPGRIPFIYFQF